MKFRLALLFIMVLCAAVIGLYVSSCEVPPAEGPGSERQTSGTLEEEDPYTSPGSHHENDADRGVVPTDVSPVEVPSHGHEHEHSSPGPEGHHHD